MKIRLFVFCALIHLSVFAQVRTIAPSKEWAKFSPKQQDSVKAKVLKYKLQKAKVSVNIPKDFDLYTGNLPIYCFGSSLSEFGIH